MTSPLGHIGSHLEELRKRVFISFAAILGCSLVAYIFSEPITRLFLAPLFNAHPMLAKLVYTNLTEAFIAYLKVSLLVGILFSFPVILYECWMFAAPGLHGHEKKLILIIVFWASALFAAGAGFAYFIVLPRILSFFLGFIGTQLEPLPKLSGYLTFAARTSLTFGLAFEIPFLMVMATKTRLVSKHYFRQKRKYYLLIILFLSFLLTAGDLFAAALLFLPLLGLYEAGIQTIRIFGKPVNSPSKKGEQDIG